MSMVTPLVEGPLIDNVNTTSFEKSHQLLQILFPFHQAKSEGKQRSRWIWQSLLSHQAKLLKKEDMLQVIPYWLNLPTVILFPMRFGWGPSTLLSLRLTSLRFHLAKSLTTLSRDIQGRQKGRPYNFKVVNTTWGHESPWAFEEGI